MRISLRLIPLWLAVVSLSFGQSPHSTTPPDSSLVQRALAAELRAAQDKDHPMRYRLRKWSPRLSTTKDLIETQDGTVARLIAVNDHPLDSAQEAKEQQRLQLLLADPGKQRHRMAGQEADTARALKVLRALPQAFDYRYAGQTTVNGHLLEEFAFEPNPTYDPPDLETEALTALAGQIWIDPASERVAHLEGHLVRDVDFGWGILGRLYKGGWITMDQSDVGGGIWRIVRFQMDMSARVVIRNRNFRTIEETSRFEPVPVGLNYRQGIGLLEQAK